MRTLLAALITLVPFAAGAQAPDTIAAPTVAEPVDTIALRFAWPDSMEVRVEGVRKRVRTTGGRTDSITTAVTYEMRVRPHRDGRVIHYHNFRFPFAEDRASADAMPEVMARVSAMLPTIVVSDEGDFIRVENIAQMRAQIDTLFGAAFAELGQPGTSEQVLATLRGLMSEESLTASAADEWNAITGQWAGADLELGEVYIAESVQPFPLVPGVSIPFEYEFSVRHWLPCHDEADEAECVEVVLVSYPEVEAMTEVMERFLRQVAPAEAATFRDVEIENTVMVILEPVTLIPHGARIVREVRMAEELRQVDVREWKYRYEATGGEGSGGSERK